MDPASMALMAVTQIPGLIGDIQSLVESGKSREEMRRALTELYGVEIPPLEDLLTAAEQVKSQEDIGPGETRNAQMDALRQLNDISSRGGLDDAALAANRQSEQMAGQFARNQVNALQGQQRRMGNMDSGRSFVSQQMASQDAANRLSMAGAENAANAQMRALQAIQSKADLATGVRGQDEAQAAQNRAARMEIDRFNAEARNAASQFNANLGLNRSKLDLDRAKAINSAAQGKADVGVVQNEQDKNSYDDIGKRTTTIMGAKSGGGKK